LNFHFSPFNVLVADICLSTQTGDEALAGREEKDIQIHTFPANSQRARKICFKGYYLSIYNKQTGDYATHIDNANGTPSTEYLEYDVPAGYSVYVRGGSVYFTVL
jgi:hypothetical protein